MTTTRATTNSQKSLDAETVAKEPLESCLSEANALSQLAHREKFWHRSTPAKVVAAHQEKNTAASWDLWQRHLATRKPATIPNVLRTQSPFLLWGLPPKRVACVAEWLCPTPFSTSQETADEVVEYLKEVDIAPVVGKPNLPHSLECVGLAYALPGLAAYLNGSQWWKLCHHLWVTAEKASLYPAEDDPTTTLAVQLAGGELPLVLAYGLPEMKPLRKLRKSGWELLSESLVELLDGEGLPKASCLSSMRGLLACWARSKLLGQQFKKGGFSDAADIQFGWLVRQAIRLSRVNGTAILSDVHDGEWSPELFKIALETGGDDSDSAAADALLPPVAVPADADFDDDDLPEPSLNSAWSGLAVLASGWNKELPRLTVTYGENPPRIELDCGRHLLWSGTWEFELRCDDQPVVIEDEWEAQCWQADEECDFLELAVKLSHGLRLERHLLLGKTDKVLYLADYVLGDQSEHEFDYRMQVPLAPEIEFLPEVDTRDGVLQGTKCLAAIFPLALPEWRIDSHMGELVAVDGKLTLTHRVKARNFCCPLLVDLKPRRIAKARTWRQLTVAESLKVQNKDVAVAFRAQSGKDQWFIYRSLSGPASRTALGQHLSSQFMAGRFLNTGEVDEFIEIETDE